MTESEEDPSEGIPQHLLNEDYALALYLQVRNSRDGKSFKSRFQ